MPHSKSFVISLDDVTRLSSGTESADVTLQITSPSGDESFDAHTIKEIKRADALACIGASTHQALKGIDGRTFASAVVARVGNTDRFTVALSAAATEAAIQQPVLRPAWLHTTERVKRRTKGGPDYEKLPDDYQPQPSATQLLLPSAAGLNPTGTFHLRIEGAVHATGSIISIEPNALANTLHGREVMQYYLEDDLATEEEAEETMAAMEPPAAAAVVAPQQEEEGEQPTAEPKGAVSLSVVFDGSENDEQQLDTLLAKALELESTRKAL